MIGLLHLPAIALALGLGLGIGVPRPGHAQEEALKDPLVVMDESFALWSAEDLTGYREYMSAAIRRARQEDVLAPDWAFIFGTYSDFLRNEDRNSPLALRLAEEGLAYLAPHAAENPDLLALLQISRVYALADLGRFDEAVQAARLAEPLFRKTMGDQMADDLQEVVSAWERRETTIFNNAPADLARQTLTQADAALDRGEYGAALTIAARASLPEGSGLDADEVARVNAAAAARTGRALYWLGRPDDAFGVLRRAAESVAGTNWENAASPALRLDPMGERQALADMFFWLARSALDTDALWIVLPALDMAATLDDGTLGLLPITFARAAFQDAIFEPEAAEAEFARAVEVAKAKGDPGAVLLAQFYLTSRRFQTTGADAEAEALIALTRQMARDAEGGSFYDPIHIQSEAAQVLLESRFKAEGLEFARAALAGRLAGISASTDTDLGQQGQRAQTRLLVEAFLQSAHRVDSDNPGADCSRPADQGFGCTIFYGR